MPKYRLVLDAHAMDHIPDEDMPDVGKGAHALLTGLQRADWKLHAAAKVPPMSALQLPREPTRALQLRRVLVRTAALPLLSGA